jgi:hypothetical protein
MKRMSTLIIGLTLGAAGALCAQGKGAAGRPVRHTEVAKPTSPAPASKPAEHSSFRGVATKLGTTPDALETAYQTAKQANPKLSRGNFVAANMLAHNLGAKNSAITTPAILSGLQSGKSIGQTLQGLGLSAKDAENAERQAKRDAAAAQRATM